MRHSQTNLIAKGPQKRTARREEVCEHKSAGLMRRHAWVALFSLLAVFLLLQWFVPLSTAITVGADEGFELSRVVLCVAGYNLYADIWNDQPPLYTFLLTQLVERFSASILGLRLLTTGFALLLLSGFFLICLRVSGLLVAGVATAFLIMSPGFMVLSSSCMVEIPALAPVVAALCVLAVGPRTKWRVTEIVAGVLFAVGLQIKLIGIIYLPLVALLIWLRERTGRGA
jgi:4-amino-4-deoxy-L-arabinose transferase-like glycosyltransferase